MNKKEFKVGAGIQPLTYPKEWYPACTQFAVCDELYDECYVRAIALMCGEDLMIILSYDLSDIPEVPDLEEKVAAACNTTADNIMICVTHNHSSYCDRGCKSADEQSNAVFRKRFLEIEEKASIFAAQEAVGSMRSARVGYGEIDSFINENEIAENSRLGVNLSNEEGIYFSDKTLAVIKFVDEQERVIAVLMNYCCHATFGMCPKADGSYVISGNFSGITSRFVEAYYGEGTVAAWTSGAAGNQHPAHRGNMLKKNYTDGYTGNVTIPCESELVLMEYAGRKHGTDAVNCIDSITEYQDVTTLKRAKNSIFLDNQKALEPVAKNRHDRTDFGPGVKSNRAEKKPELVPEIMVPDPDHRSELKMETMMIGDDICLIGMGAEPFCQIGAAIKKAVPAKHTVVVTHTPGYVGEKPQAVGYIVDKTSVNAGIDKCFRNLIPGAYDEMIVDNALKLYKEAND